MISEDEFHQRQDRNDQGAAYANRDEVLADNAGRFIAPQGPDVMRRVAPFHAWIDARRRHGVYPYERTSTTRVGPAGQIADSEQMVANFGFQDYLNLSSHERVLAAAHDAVDSHGVHSAGAPFWQGRGPLTDEVAHRIGELTGMAHVVLFASGWASSFGTVQALVRPYDHVVFDRLSHASLQTGIHTATENTYAFAHNDVDAVEASLREIRRNDARNGVLVVTESLFSIDSDWPDIALLQEVCERWGARLLVDSAHDMGAVGSGGTGQIGVQGMHGRVDLLCGSFSKVFAFVGGYFATNDEAVATHVRLMASPYLFSNAVSPVALAVVNEAVEIATSDEGERLRDNLARNTLRMRAGLGAWGLEPFGDPSPIVAVPAPSVEKAVDAVNALFRRGVSANLVEFPAVAPGTARLRFQMMAEHTPEQIDYAISACASAFGRNSEVADVIDIRDHTRARADTQESSEPNQQRAQGRDDDREPDIVKSQ